MAGSRSATGQHVRRLVAITAASAGEQNFLGARWVPVVLAATPQRLRTDAALRLLALSPHYFAPGQRIRHSEAERNRQTRQVLADEVLARYLHPDDDVLDVGCGPGYLAAAVAPRVHSVTAVDVSPGVLACARILNPAPNLEYRTVDEFTRTRRDVDVVYSFAVVQHLTDEVFARALRDWHAALRPGGLLILHVVVDDPQWRTEAQWRADRGLVGRVKFRFGLNCFGRTAEQVRGLAAAAGFGELELVPMATVVDVDDDVARQHLLLARRMDVALSGDALAHGKRAAGSVPAQPRTRPASYPPSPGGPAAEQADPAELSPT